MTFAKRVGLVATIIVPLVLQLSLVHQVGGEEGRPGERGGGEPTGASLRDLGHAVHSRLGRTVNRLTRDAQLSRMSREHLDLPAASRQRYLQLIEQDLKPFIARCRAAYKQQSLISLHLARREKAFLEYLRTSIDGEVNRQVWISTLDYGRPTIEAWPIVEQKNTVSLLQQKLLRDDLSAADMASLQLLIRYLCDFWTTCTRRDGLYEQLQQSLPDQVLIVSRPGEFPDRDPYAWSEEVGILEFMRLREEQLEAYVFPPSFYSEFKELLWLKLPEQEFQVLTARLGERWQHLDQNNYQGLIARYRRRQLDHRPEPPRTLQGEWLFDAHAAGFRLQDIDEAQVAAIYNQYEMEEYKQSKSARAYVKEYQRRAGQFHELPASPFLFPEALRTVYALLQPEAGLAAQQERLPEELPWHTIPPIPVREKLQLPPVTSEVARRVSRFPSLHTADVERNRSQKPRDMPDYHFATGTKWVGKSFDGPFVAEVELRVESADEGLFKGRLTLLTMRFGRQAKKSHGAIVMVEGLENGSSVTMDIIRDVETPGQRGEGLAGITMEGTISDGKWEADWKVPAHDHRAGRIHLSRSIRDAPPPMLIRSQPLDFTEENNILRNMLFGR